MNLLSIRLKHISYYKEVRKVSPPKMTPAALGKISIQSFFGSLVQP